MDEGKKKEYAAAALYHHVFFLPFCFPPFIHLSFLYSKNLSCAIDDREETRRFSRSSAMNLGGRLDWLVFEVEVIDHTCPIIDIAVQSVRS